MSGLLSARGQMAISLAFHILFAVAGMAMPLLMVIAEALHLRTGDATYRAVAQRWAKGTAILFAVGAVSGTVLSFELGLLWPTFMEHAGPLIGMPFSLEGFAFFLEAIALGVYLYGWDRVPRWAHLASGVVVAVSGLASGTFVMAVNAWMNTPVGFDLTNGDLMSAGVGTIDPWAAFSAASFPTQATHMAFAAYASVSIAALGVHAWRLRKDVASPFHRAALRITFGVVLVTVPLQIVSGHFSAEHIAQHQPAKLAAAEGLFRTTRRAPLTIGGWPDVEAREMRFGIAVPAVLSILAHHDPNAEVAGLDTIARADWPPVAIVHVAFQVMVGCGLAMLALVAWGAFVRLRRGALWRSDAFLRAAAISAPIGLVALEAGWVVTEVGRQPWIIHGVMRTAEAVTPMPGLWVTFLGFTILYVFLGVVVLVLLRAHVFSVPETTSPRPSLDPGSPETGSHPSPPPSPRSGRGGLTSGGPE